MYLPKEPLEVTMTGVMAERVGKEQNAPLSSRISIFRVSAAQLDKYSK